MALWGKKAVGKTHPHYRHPSPSASEYHVLPWTLSPLLKLAGRKGPEISHLPFSLNEPPMTLDLVYSPRSSNLFPPNSLPILQKEKMRRRRGEEGS